jgi:putative ABC transport system permease protein
MPAREILILAWEALIANKLRAGLTMLGMIIGVGAVVLLVSVGNGARNYITSEFEGLGTNLILIQPGRTDRRQMGPPIGSSKDKLTIADVDALQKRAMSLEAVTGIVFGAGQVKFEDQLSNVQVLGSNEKLLRILSIKVGLGQFFAEEDDLSGRRVVVLGSTVAKNLFQNQYPIGRMVKISDSEFRIIGVTQSQGQSLGFNMDELVFIPNKAAMRIFNEDKLFGIRARAKSKVSVEDAVKEIDEVLRDRRNGIEDYTITTQAAMLDSMNTILGMLTYVLGGIAMISMLVGGIGIMNIMLVSVTERTREIGVRRAVGAKKVDVLKQFIAEAVALSLCGGLIGLSGSVFITYLVSWLVPGFDMRAPVWILAPAFLISCAVGVGFGVWPAKKAASIPTIDALRFE